MDLIGLWVTAAAIDDRVLSRPAAGIDPSSRQPASQPSIVSLAI
jgi:hypothetical protein